MSSILNRIDERIRVLGISRRKASINAGLGPDYIRDLARSKNVSPGMAAIEKLAPALETTVEWLRGDRHTTTGDVTERPMPRILGEETLPLFRSAEAGPGYIVVNTTPIRHIQRPNKLENNEEAFAVVVSGESMSPEYEPGDQLFVDPYKPLVRGRSFIFIDDRDGEWKACVKKLIGWNRETFFVFQHNPPEGQSSAFELKRSEWRKAYRVLGKYDGD